MITVQNFGFSSCSVNPDTVETRTIDQREIESFRDHIYQEYGIFFPESKFYSLESKLLKRLRTLGIEDLVAYEDYLHDHSEEVAAFLDSVSTNTTKFYREVRHWEFFEEELIPAWTSDSGQINLWSAACSTGEEPYTAAMILDDRLRSNRDQPISSAPYRVLGTDLSEEAVRSGLKGVVNDRALRPLDNHKPGYRDRYFEPIGDSRYQVAETIRDQVVFRQFNLKSEHYPYRNTFDLILIRNVLIYFDEAMTEHVIHHLTQALKDGGHLFTGHSETLNNISHSLNKVQPAIYQKT